MLRPPANGSPVHGRPISNLAFAVSYAISGERPLGYHVFNVALHWANCWLLFGVVRLGLQLPRVSETLATRASAVALTAAALWAVHPLATAAVNYVSQRTELLAAFFYLLTTYCAIRCFLNGSSIHWELAAVVAAAVGMACKETMATAPLAILLVDRCLVGGPWHDWLRQRWRLYAGLAATWAIAAFLALHAGTRSGSAGFGAGVSPWRYLCTQFQALTIYLKLQGWPHPLVFDYGLDLAIGLRSVWPYAVLIAVLFCATIVVTLRRPRVGLLALLWFLILAPTSSILPIRTQTIAEHRAYLPLAVTLVGLACALSILVHRRAAMMICAALAITLAAATWQRNRTYASELSIWRDVLSKRPTSARAYFYVAVLDALPHGDARREIALYDEALRLDPAFTEAYLNRSGANLINDPSASLADADRAVRIEPRNPVAYVARAKAHRALGHFQSALDDSSNAIRLSPGLADGYATRASAYRGLGERALALDDYGKAIALAPTQSSYYFNRAGVEVELGYFAPAEADYERALQLVPDFADAFNGRGIARASLGRHADAVADFTRAIALAPAPYGPYVNRAYSLSALGRFDEAAADARRAEDRGGRVDPHSLELLKKQAGRSP